MAPGGKFLLPLVDVYGRLLERPTFAVVKAAKDALPKDDEVAKIKRQFKDRQGRLARLFFGEVKGSRGRTASEDCRSDLWFEVPVIM